MYGTVSSTPLGNKAYRRAQVVERSEATLCALDSDRADLDKLRQRDVDERGRVTKQRDQLDGQMKTYKAQLEQAEDAARQAATTESSARTRCETLADEVRSCVRRGGARRVTL